MLSPPYILLFSECKKILSRPFGRPFKISTFGNRNELMYFENIRFKKQGEENADL